MCFPDCDSPGSQEWSQINPWLPRGSEEKSMYQAQGHCKLLNLTGKGKHRPQRPTESSNLTHMLREEQVNVPGPVKKQQPECHIGGGGVVQ